MRVLRRPSTPENLAAALTHIPPRCKLEAYHRAATSQAENSIAGKRAVVFPRLRDADIIPTEIPAWLPPAHPGYTTVAF